MKPVQKQDLICSLESALRILNRETQDLQQLQTVASLCQQVSVEVNQEIGAIRNSKESS